MTKRAVIVIYNRKSGSAITPQRLRGMCSRAGLRVAHLLPIDNQLVNKLPPLLARGTWVLVVGGDGTVNSVANMIVGTGAVLVPLPGGTLNHFTKDLGVDQKLSTAIRAAAHTRPHLVDVAEINGTYFINNSSIGVYPQSLRTRKRTEDRLGKWPAALWGLLRAFVIYRTYEVEIGRKTYITPFIFVGNGDYHLQDIAAEGRTTLTGGVLSVYIVNSASRFNLIRIFSRALVGRLHTERDFVYFTARSITIDSPSRYVRVAFDGESSKLAFPLRYRMHAKGLSIVSPNK